MQFGGRHLLDQHIVDQLVCPDVSTQPFDVDGKQPWKITQSREFDGEAYLVAVISTVRSQKVSAFLAVIFLVERTSDCARYLPFADSEWTSPR